MVLVSQMTIPAREALQRQMVERLLEADELLGEVAIERGVGKGELPRAVVEGILRECLRPVTIQLDRPAA